MTSTRSRYVRNGSFGSRIWRSHLLRDNRGASAVEFAIIAPLFFMITFGAISGSLLYQQRSEITAAAREGARYGATLPADSVITGCTGTTGQCWAQHVRRITISRAFGNLDDGIAGRKVCVALVEGNPPVVITDYIADPDGVRSSGSGPCHNDATSLPAGEDPGRRVQVSTRRTGNLNAILVNMSIPLSSDASVTFEDRPLSDLDRARRDRASGVAPHKTPII